MSLSYTAIFAFGHQDKVKNIQCATEHLTIIKAVRSTINHNYSETIHQKMQFKLIMYHLIIF